MPALSDHWTREQVQGLPDDGRRYELVDGELLVSPSPRRRHQKGMLRLYRELHSYVTAHAVGVAMISPADLDLQSGQLVQPDLFVEKLIDCRPPREWNEVGIPLLVVEVLSPSTARHDRLVKRRLYQRCGVPIYWIVDLDAGLVEVWTPEADRPVIAEVLLEWHPEGASEPLAMDLAEYFRDVCS